MLIDMLLQYVLLITMGGYELKAAQAAGYLPTRYCGVARKDKRGIILKLYLISVLFYANYYNNRRILEYFLLIFSIFIVLLCIALQYKRSRIKLSFTARTKRLLLCKAVLLALEIWLYSALNGEKHAIIDLISAFVCVFLSIWICLVIMLPIESALSRRYIIAAKQKLAVSRAKVIAITGSYGKTSVKNYLYTILSEKYRVFATPESYNTPLGIAKCINEGLNDADLIILEFGARKKGDVSLLCRLYPVDYAILTGINEQHLQYFRKIDRIVEEKTAIVRHKKPNGFSVINGESRYFDRIKLRLCGECYLVTDDKNRESIGTQIVGRHNILNINIACEVARRLEMTEAEIEQAKKRIQPIPHRLELLRTGAMNILDDGYNSNYDGFLAALDTLQEFDGQKVIVTPGVIELGKRQYEINYRLGAKIGEVCHYCIIVGFDNRKALSAGFRSVSSDETRLICVKNLVEAQQELPNVCSDGCTVLFENDLP